MCTNHTPAPWHFDEDRFIVGSNGKPVVEYAGCGSHMADWPNKANKHLVLAAPELLEALEFVIDRFCDHQGLMFSERLAIEKAKKAVNKAKGKD